MPSFRYKAVDDSGKLFKGVLTAFDDMDVERNLSRSGLSLIEASKLKQSGWNQWLSGSVSLRNIVEFYHRLSQTLEIGLPILSALEENSRYLPSKTMRQIAGELMVAVESGRTLYEAMEAHPKIFQKLDLAIIHMGEQGGVLPSCLKRLADFLQWKEELRAHIRKATIYPSFVIVAILAVLGVWVGYVLPQMVKVLFEMGVSIPQATLIVLASSEFFKTHWLEFGMTGGGLLGLFYLWQRTKQGKLLVHRYILKLP
ncbi:MAG: type II secretion system F family protein, partial [Desulfobacteraceae bacterium]